MRFRPGNYLVALLAVVLLALELVFTSSVPASRADTLGGRGIDTAMVAAADSMLRQHSLDSIAMRHRADSICRRDSLELLNSSSLTRPAFSGAKDSIITDFSGGRQMIYYYGGATVTYEDMKLTADYIEYDMEANTVFASGRKNPTTGEMEGLPEMSQGKSTYKMEELRYNFTTNKARITNMITQ
ncbi:MAG: hypothetical protein J6X25_04545, partial [Bacteroidales bacterium]|nr:hypothetical protein [Bacteroidales bacterium]